MVKLHKLLRPSRSQRFIKRVLGIEIGKQFQSTDFGGDLNEKQLKYCATDVIYLHKIQLNLEEILKEK